MKSAPSLRPYQRDQVQRVAGISAPPLSPIGCHQTNTLMKKPTPRGYIQIKHLHRICHV